MFNIGQIDNPLKNTFPVLMLHIEGEKEGIEFAIARIERKVADGHGRFICETPIDITIEQAAERRDCTMNAVLFDILTGEILDPFDGISDIKNRIIRHTSAWFAEDPLRVLRVMQFAARFGFDVSRETIELCASLLDKFPTLSLERICDIERGEIAKMVLKSKTPSKGLKFLLECGWNKHFTPLLQFANDLQMRKLCVSVDSVAALLDSSFTDNQRVAAFLTCLALEQPKMNLGKFKEFFQRFKFSNDVKNISLELFEKSLDCICCEGVPQCRKTLSSLKTVPMLFLKQFLKGMGLSVEAKLVGITIANTPAKFFTRLVSGDDLRQFGFVDGAAMGAELKRLFNIQLELLLDKEQLLQLVQPTK